MLKPVPATSPKNTKTEAARIIRYFGLSAISIILSRKGLPADMQGPVMDIIAQFTAAAGGYVWSLWRDRQTAT